MSNGNDDDASANIDTKKFEWSLRYNRILQDLKIGDSSTF